MPRRKKKPDYNATQIMREFMEALVDAFGSYDDWNGEEPKHSLNAVTAEFEITALRARKLLITAGVYSTQISRTITELHASGAKLDQIMFTTGLSRTSVHSYLPYTRLPYNMDDLSVNAERIRLYRKRKQQCEELILHQGKADE